MTDNINKGAAFLLKVHASERDQYETVAGLRATSFAINGDVVVISRDQSDGWRNLLSGTGARSVSIGAVGIFLGSKAEATVRGSALSGTVDAYELSFEDGTRLRGKFLIQRFDFAGNFNGERNFSLQLESSGEVVPV